MTQWHSDTAHVHAVTHFNGDQRAWYDQNGNPSAALGAGMTQRVEISGSQRITYTQEWDIDPSTSSLRQAQGKQAGGADAIRRDEHGGRPGDALLSGCGRRAGEASSVASSQMAWLHGDHPSTSSGYHLGSASMTTNASGQKACPERSRRGGRVALSAVWRDAVGVGHDADRPAACPERSRRVHGATRVGGCGAVRLQRAHVLAGGLLSSSPSANAQPSSSRLAAGFKPLLRVSWRNQSVGRARVGALLRT